MLKDRPRNLCLLIAFSILSASIVGCGKKTKSMDSSGTKTDSKADSKTESKTDSKTASKTDSKTDSKPNGGDPKPPSKDDPSKDDNGKDAPKATCTVDAAELAGWFQGGTITKDGLVTTANSLQKLNTACDFYKWSWRMFLWQTSRTSEGLVFNVAPFFDLNDNNQLVTNSSTGYAAKRVRGGKFEKTDRTGQAGVVSGVLMTQPPKENADGSLVYYGIHVNDVMAYLASGVNSKDLTDVTQFPTTAAERDTIVQYAKQAYGVDIADGDSLAMELKSSWIKTDGSMDLTRFITIQSDIPKYVQDSDKKWTWDGQSMEVGVTLACVGYHLVGSTADHPEMVWATFEHTGNAPDADYYYINAEGEVTLKENWNQDGTPIQKDWLFMDGVSKRQSTNQMRMEMKGTEILATTNKTIGASNTSRTHPWGNVDTAQSAQNNTDIISLNDSIRSQLAEGDVRANYLLIGATWTRNGVPGVGLQIPEVAGSLTLANTSMETYFQFKNCFGCHQGGKLSGLSHIFGGIKPLPKTVP